MTAEPPAPAAPAESSVGTFDPETAFLAPVAGPETTVIPTVVPTPPGADPVPGGDPTTPPTRPAASPNPRAGGGAPDGGRGRRRTGRHRPDHTLADDIFELGDDDE
jgi:hypothetical protein